LSTRDASVAGYCDGVKGDSVRGWAWRPEFPDEPVEIEMVVDGVVVAKTVADLYRPDLRAVGIGHGRYGWRFALELPAGASGPREVIIRERDGEPLANGVLQVSVDPPNHDAQNAEFQAFVSSVLNSGPLALHGVRDAETKLNFLLYCPVPMTSHALGAPQYSYAFVMKAFAPLLARLGRIHMILDPAAEADRLYESLAEQGEASVLLSFAPPHHTVLGLRCPTIPVIAWEFPTIPSRVWDGDRRHDWRFVLRQTGRAITLSQFAADAIRAAMGADFPVVAVPAPVWDRTAAALPVEAPPKAASLSVDGFVFDTRGRSFPPAAATPPLPDPDRRSTEMASETTLSGVVFTAVFSPKDGRKNWPDIVTAFVTAHRDHPDATLVLKMVGADAGLWWWELHDVLGRLPAFECRLVVLNGYLDDDAYRVLIEASHWAVNASRAEGLCLPLVEFMCAGRPAIAPLHTAMLDYITPFNALIVESDEEYCGWPHDPLNEMTTTRRRVSWSSLIEAFSKGYQIARDKQELYASLSKASQDAMHVFCSDDAVAARLDAFLGLNLGRGREVISPSPLLMSTAA